MPPRRPSPPTRSPPPPLPRPRPATATPRSHRGGHRGQRSGRSGERPEHRRHRLASGARRLARAQPGDRDLRQPAAEGGATTLGEALNTLPQFRGSTRPTTGTTSALGARTGSFLNLRNLGVQRTLTLLDGRRAAPSSTVGSSDTNLFPQELVKRVDVVTGGASGTYGSDAVAGVVNFVLDTRFTGLTATAQTGISGAGDARTFKGTLTGGTAFADERARIVVSGSAYDAKGLGDQPPATGAGRGSASSSTRRCPAS